MVRAAFVVPLRFAQVVVMTLIVLAPTTTAKAGSRSFLRDYRRPCVACGALVTSMLLASYSSNGAAPQPSTGAVTTPQRAGHNPSYYVEFGKRYYIRESSEGYRERGVASWYGGDFHGRKTSSGERYDMHAMTAAHPTLPIPTWVEVTNLGNGKHVIVKINDRGPFVDQRLIDLSHAAASALDMVRTGTARVEVRAVDAPPEATARNRGHPSASSTSASSTSARALRPRGFDSRGRAGCCRRTGPPTLPSHHSREQIRRAPRPSRLHH